MAGRVSQYRVVRLLAVFALFSFVACQALACLPSAPAEARKQSAHCPNEATPETFPNACQQNLATEPSPTQFTATAIKMAPDGAARSLSLYEQPTFPSRSKVSPVSNESASTRSAHLYLLAHALRI